MHKHINTSLTPTDSSTKEVPAAAHLGTTLVYDFNRVQTQQTATIQDNSNIITNVTTACAGFDILNSHFVSDCINGWANNGFNKQYYFTKNALDELRKNQNEVRGRPDIKNLPKGFFVFEDQGRKIIGYNKKFRREEDDTPLTLNFDKKEFPSKDFQHDISTLLFDSPVTMSEKSFFDLNPAISPEQRWDNNSPELQALAAFFGFKVENWQRGGGVHFNDNPKIPPDIISQRFYFSRKQFPTLGGLYKDLLNDFKCCNLDPNNLTKKYFEKKADIELIKKFIKDKTGITLTAKYDAILMTLSTKNLQALFQLTQINSQPSLQSFLDKMLEFSNIMVSKEGFNYIYVKNLFDYFKQNFLDSSNNWLEFMTPDVWYGLNRITKFYPLEIKWFLAYADVYDFRGKEDFEKIIQSFLYFIDALKRLDIQLPTSPFYGINYSSQGNSKLHAYYQLITHSRDPRDQMEQLDFAPPDIFALIALNEGLRVVHRKMNLDLPTYSASKETFLVPLSRFICEKSNDLSEFQLEALFLRCIATQNIKQQFSFYLRLYEEIKLLSREIIRDGTRTFDENDLTLQLLKLIILTVTGIVSDTIQPADLNNFIVFSKEIVKKHGASLFRTKIIPDLLNWATVQSDLPITSLNSILKHITKLDKLDTLNQLLATYKITVHFRNPYTEESFLNVINHMSDASQSGKLDESYKIQLSIQANMVVQSINSLNSCSRIALELKARELRKTLTNNKNIYNLFSFSLAIALIVRLIEIYYEKTLTPNQIIAILDFYNHPGKGLVEEVVTGEGKSLILAATSLLFALHGRQIDIVTPNNYLAERDANYFKILFRQFGLTVTCVKDTADKEDYQGDVRYVPIKSLIHHGEMAMIFNPGYSIKRDIVFVDEADFALFDEDSDFRIAITSILPERAWLFRAINCFIDSTQNSEQSSTELKNWLLFHYPSHVKSIQEINDIQLRIWIRSAHQAKSLELDVDYLIKEIPTMTEYGVSRIKRAIIVDYTSTGRLNKHSQWDSGIHQFLHERLQLNPIPETSVVAASSFCQFISSSYKTFFGITGTAGSKTELQFMENLLGVNAHSIPRYKADLRINLGTVITDNKTAKFERILLTIKKMQEDSRPVLVFFKTIRDCREYSDWLKMREVDHQNLDEKQDEPEEFIVRNAGRPKALTLATAVASRGTDILLTEISRKSGGLHIVPTFDMEAEGTNEQKEYLRLFFQIIGRGGRQGDPGSYEIILEKSDITTKQNLKVKLNNKISKEGIAAIKFTMLKNFSELLSDHYQTINTFVSIKLYQDAESRSHARQFGSAQYSPAFFHNAESSKASDKLADNKIRDEYRQSLTVMLTKEIFEKWARVFAELDLFLEQMNGVKQGTALISEFDKYVTEQWQKLKPELQSQLTINLAEIAKHPQWKPVLEKHARDNQNNRERIFQNNLATR